MAKIDVIRARVEPDLKLSTVASTAQARKDHA